MPAQALNFSPYLQIPLEADVLTPHQAWRLMWELECLPLEPWTPGVMEISQRVSLFHREAPSLPQ